MDCLCLIDFFVPDRLLKSGSCQSCSCGKGRCGRASRTGTRPRRSTSARSSPTCCSTWSASPTYAASISATPPSGRSSRTPSSTRRRRHHPREAPDDERYRRLCFFDAFAMADWQVLARTSEIHELMLQAFLLRCMFEG